MMNSENPDEYLSGLISRSIYLKLCTLGVSYDKPYLYTLPNGAEVGGGR